MSTKTCVLAGRLWKLAPGPFPGLCRGCGLFNSETFERSCGSMGVCVATLASGHPGYVFVPADPEDEEQDI